MSHRRRQKNLKKERSILRKHDRQQRLLRELRGLMPQIIATEEPDKKLKISDKDLMRIIETIERAW